MDDDPFPVEGLFQEMTAPAATRELLAGMAEQARAIRKVLDAVRYGTATLPQHVLDALEQAAEIQPFAAAH